MQPNLLPFCEAVPCEESVTELFNLSQKTDLMSALNKYSQ